MDKLINLLLDRIREETEGLVNVPASSLHEYHRRVGEIQGMKSAVQMILDARRDADHDKE